MRGSYDPTAYANKRGEAIERAKKLREQRKMAARQREAENEHAPPPSDFDPDGGVSDSTPPRAAPCRSAQRLEARRDSGASGWVGDSCAAVDGSRSGASGWAAPGARARACRLPRPPPPLGRTASVPVLLRAAGQRLSSGSVQSLAARGGRVARGGWVRTCAREGGGYITC